MRSLGSVLGAASLALLAAACEGEPLDTFDDTVGSSAAPLAIEGRFRAPESTLALGDAGSVEYTGAGPWRGEAGCAGGMEPGTEALRQYLLASWPQIDSIGGYACRAIVGNASQTSVHATGRALDIMLPLTSDGAADNDLGDPIARWLIEHASEIGVQLIIWDRTVWQANRAPGAKEKEYGGAHPHHDHLHVELSVEAGSEMGSPWFQVADHGPPGQPGCGAVGADGAVLDDGGDCLTMFGATASWRAVSGAGEGGGLLWTHAWQSGAPGNWARWYVEVAEPGRYEVEVNVPAGYGVHRATRYEVVHGRETTTVELDQASGAGWRSLGAFDFAAGFGQHVSVFDNSVGPVAADQKIAVDAIRLTRGSGGGAGDPLGEGGDLGGGCATGEGVGWSGLALVALALVRRR